MNINPIKVRGAFTVYWAKLSHNISICIALIKASTRKEYQLISWQTKRGSILNKVARYIMHWLNKQELKKDLSFEELVTAGCFAKIGSKDVLSISNRLQKLGEMELAANPTLDRLILIHFHVKYGSPVQKESGISLERILLRKLEEAATFKEAQILLSNAPRDCGFEKRAIEAMINLATNVWELDIICWEDRLDYGLEEMWRERVDELMTEDDKVIINKILCLTE